MNNTIPKELAERQEQQRRNTVNIVRRAIEDLSAEGHMITIKRLIEYTGLSRSVFGKNHVKAVLRECSISEKRKENHCIQITDKEERLKTIIKEQNERIIDLENENRKLKEECELLRGSLFLKMNN